MANEQQGVMSLPSDPTMSVPPGSPMPQQAMPQEQLSRADAYDATIQALVATRPDLAQGMDEALMSAAAELEGLPLQDLQDLLGLIEYMMDNEAEYPDLRESLLAKGVFEEGDLPEQYDPEFLSVMEIVLRQAIQAQQGMDPEMAPPPGFARGGIADAAAMTAAQGRYGDTMLAHINPEEAAMLRRMGGSGSINPRTGLPEYFSLKGLVNSVTNTVKKVAKTVVNVAKKVVSSPIGKVIATVGLTALAGIALPTLGMSASFAAPLGQAAATMLGGGSLKDGLISGAMSYFGGSNSPLNSITQPLANAMGATSNVAMSAVNQGLLGAGAGLLSGKSLQDSVRQGLTSGAMGAAGTYATEGYLSNNQPNELLAPVRDGKYIAPTPTASSNQSFSGATGSSQQGSGGMFDSVTGLFKDDKGDYSPWKIGLGAVGLMGLTGMGTKVEDIPQSQMEQDMRKPIEMPQNLTKATKFMNGVTYDENGMIQDSQRWDPNVSLQDTIVPADRFPQYGYAAPPPPPQNMFSMGPQAPGAGSGIARLSEGGYPRRMGHIAGPGTSTSDSIPAMLSDGEFVMTADAVLGAGNGDREQGAQKMYQLMHMLEQKS